MYYNLHTHQYHSHSHFHSESPTSRFTTTSFHPTRHLLFILPLSQPHLLSFLILLLFWTNGKRSELILCGRHYSYPLLLSSFCSLLVQPYPSSSHTPFTRLKTNTPHSFQTKASQTLSFATTKETVCEASTSILCACGYTLHDERRVTQQSPRYEPLRRSKDSRRTRLRHRNHLLNARVCCCAMLCTALH